MGGCWVAGRFQARWVLTVAAMAWAHWIATAGCAAQSAPALYTVSGVVKNSVTGQPIERALVDGAADAAMTDSEGRFELHLQEGQAQIQVRRPGYGDGGRGAGRLVRVNAKTPELTLSLTPQASITGRLTASNGGDAEGIAFTAYRKRTMNGRVRWMQAGNATSNSEGIFRMYEMEAPASYILCSRPTAEQQGARVRGAPVWGYASVCFPGEPDDGEANVLNLAAGQQADVEIAVTRQPLYAVSLVELNAAAGQGMSIQIHDHTGRTVGFALRMDAQRHTAEAQLPNGSYYAEARAWGETMAYGRVDFKVADAPLSGLTLTLLPLAALEVVVHKEFTANSPLAGGSRDEELNYLRGLNLVLTPVDSMSDGGGGQGLRHPDGADSSRLELSNVTPGRYWVQAGFFMGGYVSSMTSGGVDLMREPLVVGPGSSAQPIEITLRNDTGEIDCTVNTLSADEPGNAATGGLMNPAIVYAIPAESNPVPLPRAGVMPGTPARIANLAPGTYRVIAVDGLRNLDAADAAELAKLAGQGKTVTVGPGGAVNVQLDLIETDSEGANP